MAFEDKLENIKEQVEAKAKEVGGGLLGDSELEAEGVAQGFLAKAQDAVNDVTDKVSGIVDGVKEHFDKN